MKKSENVPVWLSKISQFVVVGERRNNVAHLLRMV
jgi:hypothetical protein